MAIDLAAAGFAVVATAVFCPGYFWVMDRWELRRPGHWSTLALDGVMHIGYLFALALFLESGGEALIDGWAEEAWRRLPPEGRQTLERWCGQQEFPAP